MPKASFVIAADARIFLNSLSDASVDLFVVDPPYYQIVRDAWDNAWTSEDAYVSWLVSLLELAATRLTPRGSLLMFGGIGRHSSHPLFQIMQTIECRRDPPLHYRNMITWKKRRAYGKTHDYLFCREEIVWYSRSPGRTAVTFNIPLTGVKRGYNGFNPRYPAKSEYKRVSNVWDDIPELFRPERYTQKPIQLLDRIVATHSNPGDVVSDFFAGYGTTGISSLRSGRRFLGCEAIVEDARRANDRCIVAAQQNAVKATM